MKTQTQNPGVAKVKSVTVAEVEIKKVAKVETPRQLSKKVSEKLDKIQKFDASKAGSWDKLGHVSNLVLIDGLGLNKALKNYLEISKDVLTPTQMEALTFENCKEFINNSIKYKDLQLFTTNDIKLIANKVLISKDANTARAKKVAEQGGTVGNKAKKAQRNSVK